MAAKTRIMIGLAVFSLLPFFGCGDEKPEVREVLRPVKFAKVYHTSGGSMARAFSGVAKPEKESRLSFKVGGTLQDLGIDIGDRVKKGQLIAQLDPSDLILKAQEVKASLAQAKAKARSAGADYARIRALYENNSVSLQDLDAARAVAESARATVDAVDKQVALADAQLEYTRLLAPLGGVILKVDAEVNENVSPGQTIVVVASGEKSEVTVAVPESFIARVQKGAMAEVVFDSIPGERFKAEITEVAASILEAATTYPVTVRLEKTDIRIRSGMAAEALFVFNSGDGEQSLIVPSSAVGEDIKGRHIFIVEPKLDGFGIVKRVNVTTGRLTTDGIEILSGVSDGDRVIIAGVSQIKDGQKVLMPSGPEKNN